MCTYGPCYVAQYLLFTVNKVSVFPNVDVRGPLSLSYLLGCLSLDLFCADRPSSERKAYFKCVCVCVFISVNSCSSILAEAEGQECDHCRSLFVVRIAK